MRAGRAPVTVTSAEPGLLPPEFTRPSEVPSLAPEFEPVRTRHVVTNRLTWRDQRDRLTLSLFTFYSASDDDYYLRPVVSFRQSDNWTFTGGANLFGGDQQHTFFGQLEDNSNAYFRVRFNY